MDKLKKIIIAEDNKLFRELLKSMLTNRDGFEIIGEAEDGLGAIRVTLKKKPDLLMLDLSMPRLNGFSAIKDIKSQNPDVKILVLTIHESDEYILEAFDSGVDGYCIKNAGLEELFVAIQSVLEGKKYISPGIADNVMKGYLECRRQYKTITVWETITQREKEILKLLAEGYMNKEISDLLNISVKTVEKHRANIMAKLDMHNVSALTAYAIKKGLVEQKIS